MGQGTEVVAWGGGGGARQFSDRGGGVEGMGEVLVTFPIAVTVYLTKYTLRHKSFMPGPQFGGAVKS